MLRLSSPAGAPQVGKPSTLAVRQSTGHLHDRALYRRGYALLVLGRHREALEDLNAAVVAMRAADDQIWEARALQERAVSYLLSGSARRAVSDLRRAEDLFDATGQELEAAEARMNRGLVALRLGDLPEALNCFDKAAERFQNLGATEPDLSIHRCAALTAAGLFRDAMDEAEVCHRAAGPDSRSTDQTGRTASHRSQVRAGRRPTYKGTYLGHRGA